MQTRFVCEMASGLPTGTDPVQVIEKAWEHVFGDFPIFDEGYRAGLCKKILEHYYFTDICTTPVMRWEFILNRTMREIMPYYNQLYKSELIHFNPLYDTDYWTTHDAEGTRDTTQNATSDQETNSTGNNVSHETSTENGTFQTDSSGQTSSTVGTEASGETTGKVEESRDLTHEGTDHYEDSGTTENSVTTETSGNSQEIRNLTDTTESSGTDKTNGNRNHTGNTSSSSTTKNSDTPQGGMNGISPPDPYPTDNYWLTTVQQVSGSARETTEDQYTENIERKSNSIEQHTGTIDNTSSTNSSSTEHGTSGGTHDGTNNYTDGEHKTTTSSGTSSSTSTETGTGTSTGTDTGTSTSTGAADRNTDTTGHSETTHVSETTGKTMTTDEYIDHVAGKRGSVSYSKMLEDFRKTFLNIDMQVIEALSTCWFLLHEFDGDGLSNY